MSQIDWSQLIQELQSDDVDLSIRACEIISKVADQTKVPELYALLQDESFFVREAVAEPLARLEGVSALPALFSAYTQGFQDRHDNDGLSFTIVELLKTFPKEIAPILIEMLKDTDAEVRANAAWASGFVASFIDPDMLMSMLSSETDLNVKTSLIGSLSSFKNNSKVVDTLIRMLKDEDEQILITTISSLGYLGDKRAIFPINEICNKSTKNVIEFAKDALEKLSSV
jgi:HEAT repeat protein